MSAMVRISNLFKGFLSLFVSNLERKNPEALLELEKENLRKLIAQYNEGLAAHGVAPNGNGRQRCTSAPGRATPAPTDEPPSETRRRQLGPTKTRPRSTAPLPRHLPRRPYVDTHLYSDTQSGDPRGGTGS